MIVTPRAHARARGYVIGRGVYIYIVTPRAHARARGYVIGRGVYIYIVSLQKKFRTFFYLSKYSLSDAHFNTKRLLFQFNRFQYTLAAPEVFVASVNPVSLPSGYRVSIIRNTNIDQIETTPLRYCMLEIRLNTPTWHTTCNNVKKKQKAVSETPGKPRDGGAPPRGGGAPPGPGEEAAFRQSKRAPD